MFSTGTTSKTGGGLSYGEWFSDGVDVPDLYRVAGGVNFGTSVNFMCEHYTRSSVRQVVHPTGQPLKEVQGFEENAFPQDDALENVWYKYIGLK